MKDIGVSVGEWSDNKNINFDSNFSNVSGSFFSSSYLYGNPRAIRSKLGTKEFVQRKGLYIKLTREMGLKDPLINSFWSKWLIKGNTNSDGFEKFIKDQLLLQKAKEKEEEKLLEKLKEEEEKEIINDLNLFPPKPNNSPIPNELMGDKEKESQPNYLVYGLIGLGVIVGAFLIFKKK